MDGWKLIAAGAVGAVLMTAVFVWARIPTEERVPAPTEPVREVPALAAPSVEPELDPEPEVDDTRLWSSETMQGQIRGKCDADWPDDFSMQAFCLEKQEKGLSRFAALAKIGTKNEAFARALVKCMADWVGEPGNPEADWSMLAYCGDKQLDAKKRLGL